MKKRIPILLGMILTIIAAWLLVTPESFVRTLINDIEDIGYDLQLRARDIAHPQKPDPSIVIVDVDDKSIAAEGRWPWPRKKVAMLVDKLRQQGAAVLAFDIIFPEQQRKINEDVIQTLTANNAITPQLKNVLMNNSAYFDEDAILAKSLKEIPSILSITFLPRNFTVNALPPPILKISPRLSEQLQLTISKGYLSNIPILQQAAMQGGFINIFADPDGVMRRTPLVMEFEDGIHPSLALEAVMAFVGANIELITPYYHDVKQLEAIKLGDKIIDTNAKGEVLIPFIGRSYTFPYFSATDILHDKLAGEQLLGKIVFIGTSATGLGDLQATSIQSPFPGVEIQATVANGLIKNNFSYRPAWTLGANLFLTILFGTIAAFIFPYIGPRMLAVIVILLPITMMFINIEIWARTGLILSLLMPVLLIIINAVMNMLYGYLFETRRREQLKNMFGQYVPAKHIDEMLRAGSGFAMHGEDREMSVLFADIRNFTSISENMSARELVEMLNAFFTPMTEIIFKNKGTIDKYVGDLIMAFWGAPLKSKLHAKNAIQSAISMQAKLNEIRDDLKKRGWPHFNIGIGINSGTMSVGDMGSRYRRNYTVLGDAVNLASRVESLSKFYGVHIIVTENTQKNQPDFVFRMLDKVRVKGKSDGINIYEVIGNHSVLTAEMESELLEYQQGLNEYFAQHWDAALVIMEKLHKENSERKIYRIYIDRINEFKDHPLPADWDGTYIHTDK